MLIKSSDDKQAALQELERLLLSAKQAHIQSAIKKELYIMRAGIKGENESAYLIDFELKNSKNYAVIHDLRIEINGRVAQIDHLLINRALNIYVLETKHFNSGLKIDDNGDFLRWNDYKKTYEAMPSPLKQNARHIEVLKDAFETIDLPRRLNLVLKPSFESFVLVNAQAKVIRSRKFDSSSVIKSEVLMDKVQADIGIFKTVKMLTKIMASETIENIAQELAKLHRPAKVDYAKKFGVQAQAGENSVEITAPSEQAIQTTPPVETATSQTKPQPLCNKCQSGNISISYGKYGYYIKCEDCNGNTAINIKCSEKGHKEKIRKKGNEFFSECADCGTSRLYFINKA